MIEHIIEYNGNKYPVKEPTIRTWTEMMRLRDVLDEGELFIKVIELTTGLSREDILAADATQVKQVGEQVLGIMSNSNKKVVNTFTHQEVEYEFLDISNLTFGQFIDIDTFLSKDENYRKQNLNELAAYMYIEKGTKYGERNIQHRIKQMEDLPMKYMEGAVFFLLNIARASGELTKIYSRSKMLRVLMKTKIVFRLIGVGIQQSAHSLRTRFGFLIMCLLYPLLSVSIISHSLWTIIRNKKN